MLKPSSGTNRLPVENRAEVRASVMPEPTVDEWSTPELEEPENALREGIFNQEGLPQGERSALLLSSDEVAGGYV